MELFVFICLALCFIYWLNSIRAKELATVAAKNACDKVLIEFLDDTVSIKKLRLRRNSSGRMSFYREYEFEFSSTGEFRYKGKVTLLGVFVVGVEMQPYQLNEYEI